MVAIQSGLGSEWFSGLGSSLAIKHNLTLFPAFPATPAQQPSPYIFCC